MANSKIITYDLCNSDKNYNDLYEYLKSYSSWAHICESVWFVSTTKSCADIRNEINQIIDSNDRVFVAELTGTAAWRNVLCDSEYLKNNL